MKKLFCIATLALLVTGCAKEKTPPATVIDGEKVPSWLINPTLGCAAGMYQSRGNVSMALEMSEVRATAKLGRQLQVYVRSMVRQYIEEGEHNEEAYTEDLALNVSEVVTNVSMNGAVPRKTAIHGNNFYTLVCMDPQTFIDSFDQMEQLDERVRNGLRSRAETAFNDLDRKTE